MNGELLDRMLPQDLDAERWVLGSALLDASTLDQVGWLRPDEFYGDGHRAIYATLKAMRECGQSIDPGLLVARLKTAGDYERAGGAAALHEILVAVPVPSHAVHYAGIVRQKAEYRRMIQAATMLLKEAYTASEPVEEILARAETSLMEITTGRFTGEPVDLSQAIVEATERIDMLQDRSQHVGRLTGFDGFDEIYGGLFPKELTILAARPGIGKTAWATEAAMFGAGGGRLVYFASLEMSRAELATRILCRQAGVNNRHIRTGKLSQEGRASIVDASVELSPARLKIDDRPAMTIADISRACRRLVKHGLSLAVVDYLQLVTPADKRAPREQQVAAMARGLKQMARELDIPVLCLCQLNRQAEDGEPELRHLRESGAIEQDADAVMFLYYHKPTEKAGEDHNANLKIAKYRNGECPKYLRMYWDGPSTSFECPGAGFSEFAQHAH